MAPCARFILPIETICQCSPPQLWTTIFQALNQSDWIAFECQYVLTKVPTLIELLIANMFSYQVCLWGFKAPPKWPEWEDLPANQGAIEYWKCPKPLSCQNNCNIQHCRLSIGSFWEARWCLSWRRQGSLYRRRQVDNHSINFFARSKEIWQNILIIFKEIWQNILK